MCADIVFRRGLFGGKGEFQLFISVGGANVSHVIADGADLLRFARLADDSGPEYAHSATAATAGPYQPVEPVVQISRYRVVRAGSPRRSGIKAS